MAAAAKELPACPVETTLTLISDKWKVLILRDLMPGTKRFGELKKSIGSVSQKVLTAQLREMERSGLLTRTVYPEVPPRVEYTLTDLGYSLKPILDAMRNWGEPKTGVALPQRQAACFGGLCGAVPREPRPSKKQTARAVCFLDPAVPQRQGPQGCRLPQRGNDSITRVRSGIVRIEHRVEANAICEAKTASQSYLSARIEPVLPAGIPVIRMQTLVSVVSRWSGLSSTHSRSGYRTSRRQVYHRTGFENMERMGASARIVPMTNMETGTVQLLTEATALSRKPGRDTGAAIRSSPAKTAMMQGWRTSLRKASFLLTLVKRDSPAVHMVKRSGIWNMDV